MHSQKINGIMTRQLTAQLNYIQQQPKFCLNMQDWMLSSWYKSALLHPKSRFCNDLTEKQPVYTNWLFRIEMNNQAGN